jgi:hypothetical protein
MTDFLDNLVESSQALRRPHFPDISYLDGFVTQIKTANINHAMLAELRLYLDELDVRRKQNWRGIYPWMEEIFTNELGAR